MVLVSAKHNEHIPGDAIRVGVCRNEKSFNIIYLKPATSEPKKKSLQAYKQLCTAADKKDEKIARKEDKQTVKETEKKKAKKLDTKEKIKGKETKEKLEEQNTEKKKTNAKPEKGGLKRKREEDSKEELQSKRREYSSLGEVEYGSFGQLKPTAKRQALQAWIKEHASNWAKWEPPNKFSIFDDSKKSPAWRKATNIVEVRDHAEAKTGRNFKADMLVNFESYITFRPTQEDFL